MQDILDPVSPIKSGILEYLYRLGAMQGAAKDEAREEVARGGPEAGAVAMVAPDTLQYGHPGRYRLYHHHCPCSEYNRMEHFWLSCRIHHSPPAKIVLNLCKNSR